ncbi:addiction module protein [Adhaeretor mobilis]|uniref:Addiction module component n=1 Tax=Adhaeretor mobilis TaxID=1930276 RepID=A0A517N2I7_9BACT|nr:addiction module protein [Adhaeretor mobilis]QDT01360.1 Putative addiction module component [Adhaeretor mobilis]
MVNASYQDVLTAAETLPSAERAQLVAALLSNVSPDDWSPPSPAWLAEAKRRSDAFDAGDMSGSSWAEVRERARR